MESGSFMISDVTEATGYSVTTVAKYVAALETAGEIHQINKVLLHDRGRKAVQYGITRDGIYFLGVDVRNFELTIGLIDLRGNTIRIEHDESFRLENTHSSLDYICSRILGFIGSTDGVEAGGIAGVNINLPGRINALKGTSSTIFNLEELAGTTLSDMLAERLGMPVFLENDTKAMAFGEYVTEFSRDYSNICYINIGWGLGLGIIIGGRLYYGKDGYSGEFGHIHLYDNNILCHCGKKGCLETEVSGRAIVRKLHERINAGVTSILSPKVRSGAELTMSDIIKALEKEDSLCIELVSTAGTELGHHLAGIINILNPEAIVIGGSLSQVESCYFLQYIKLAERQFSLKLMSQNVPVITSRLGNDAGVLGACLIARDKVMNEMIMDF